MNGTRAVIVFASRGGATERRAMAAAVGVVQKRGEIRLRLLSDHDDVLPPGSAWLAKEYVAPRDADAAWADALILLLPDWMPASSAAVVSYFAMLKRAREGGRFRLRAGSVVAEATTREAVERQMTALGLEIVPAGAR